MNRLEDIKLYTFIDSAYLNDKDPVTIAKALSDGGSDIIQLRAKDWDKSKIQIVCDQVLEVLRPYQIPLVINDHPDIAHNAGAPFCHLGQEDFFDAGYNHTSDIDDSLQWGLSTHAPGQAQRAIEAGPDYIAIGPIFQTPTKPEANPVTLDYVRWASENVLIPWFAIGGVNEKTVDAVLDAGAQRICVVSAILNAENIQKSCQFFKNKLNS